MDQALIASIRRNLESKSTEELRQAFEGGNISNKSPEELEAMRQVLDERRKKGTRAVIALACAVVFGSLGAAFAWWQVGPGVEVLFYGLGGALLGFASWYIPDVIPWARV